MVLNGKIKNKLLFEGIEYRAKITLKTIPTSIPVRLLSFFGTEIALIGVSYLYLKFLKNRGR